MDTRHLRQLAQDKHLRRSPEPFVSRPSPVAGHHAVARASPQCEGWIPQSEPLASQLLRLYARSRSLTVYVADTLLVARKSLAVGDTRTSTTRSMSRSTDKRMPSGASLSPTKSCTGATGGLWGSGTEPNVARVTRVRLTVNADSPSRGVRAWRFLQAALPPPEGRRLTRR